LFELIITFGWLTSQTGCPTTTATIEEVQFVHVILKICVWHLRDYGTFTIQGMVGLCHAGVQAATSHKSDTSSQPTHLSHFYTSCAMAVSQQVD
jgi:hypothetical protein